MQRRDMSANDVPISSGERRIGLIVVNQRSAEA